MGNIDWLPIDELPEELKDGREVLLWAASGEPWVGIWSSNQWRDGEGMHIYPTHFAEINEP